MLYENSLKRYKSFFFFLIKKTFEWKNKKSYVYFWENSIESKERNNKFHFSFKESSNEVYRKMSRHFQNKINIFIIRSFSAFLCNTSLAFFLLTLACWEMISLVTIYCAISASCRKQIYCIMQKRINIAQSDSFVMYM